MTLSRMTPSRLAITALAVVALVLGACGDDDDDAPDGAADTTTTIEAPATTVDETSTTQGDDEVELTQSCTNERDGYSLRYPEGWATNSGDVEPPCRFFSPGDELEIEAGTEADTAVIADVEDVSFQRATDEDRTREIISERQATIAGRDAVRIEQRDTGEGLHPEGTLSTIWYVDLGDDQTFIASARAAGGASYEQSVTALDAMIETLELEAG